MNQSAWIRIEQGFLSDSSNIELLECLPTQVAAAAKQCVIVYHLSENIFPIMHSIEERNP